MMHAGADTGMWDEEDGFFYDVLRLPDGGAQRLKVRSMVGLLPFCAVTTFDGELLERYPELADQMRTFLEARPELSAFIHDPAVLGVDGRRLAAILDERKVRRVLARMLDESEFLGPHGIRSLSRYHLEHPYVFEAGGAEYRVTYLPAESDSGMFGGNSNWRGPVWMPVNALIIRALLQYHAFYGDEFTVECPTGSGTLMTLYQVAEEIERRLASIFLRDERGRRPVYGSSERFQADPYLARPDPVLRVLRRRRRDRSRREPPDRLDGGHRPRAASLRDRAGWRRDRAPRHRGERQRTPRRRAIATAGAPSGTTEP